MTLAHIRAKASIAAVAVVLAACSRPVLEHPPEAGDVAVAKVNGRPIWKSDVVREAAAQGLIGQGEALDARSDLFHHALDEVIDQTLLAQEAAARKLDRAPAAGRRLEAARERILSDMLVEQVVAKAVNEAAIRTMYQEQIKAAKPGEELHGQQIVVASQADGEAVRKLLAAGAAFASLAARRSSDAQTKFNGGDMGYFALDVMPAPYGQALKAAKPGDVVGPFKSDAGWVVVKILDRRPQQPIALDAARPQIVRFLTYDEVRDLLDTLHGRATIQTLIPPAAPSATDKGKTKP